MEREHFEHESKSTEKKERKLTKFNASRFTGKKKHGTGVDYSKGIMSAKDNQGRQFK